MKIGAIDFQIMTDSTRYLYIAVISDSSTIVSRSIQTISACIQNFVIILFCFSCGTYLLRGENLASLNFKLWMKNSIIYLHIIPLFCIVPLVWSDVKGLLGYDPLFYTGKISFLSSHILPHQWLWFKNI